MCSIDYIRTGDDWLVFSACFPFKESSTCSSDSECRTSTLTLGGSHTSTIECCCFKDNCLNASSQVFEFLSSTTGVSVESSRPY